MDRQTELQLHDYTTGSYRSRLTALALTKASFCCHDRHCLGIAGHIQRFAVACGSQHGWAGDVLLMCAC